MQGIIALFTYESNLKYFVFFPNLVQETGSRSKRHIKDQTNLDSKSSNQMSFVRTTCLPQPHPIQGFYL